MRHGIPIMLGYFSVSFGFGVLCIQKNLSTLAAVGISVTNLTSAGQVAGVEVIAASGSLIEMILCQLVINLRYSLMSLFAAVISLLSMSVMHFSMVLLSMPASARFCLAAEIAAVLSVMSFTSCN